jgi:hypothetical protein
LAVTRHLTPADELRVIAGTVERHYGPAVAQAALLRYMVVVLRNLQRHAQPPPAPTVALDSPADFAQRLLYQAAMAEAAGAHSATEDHVKLLNAMQAGLAGLACLGCLSHLAQWLGQLGPAASRRLPQLPATEPAAALQAAACSLRTLLQVLELCQRHGPDAVMPTVVSANSRRCVLENLSAAAALLLLPRLSSIDNRRPASRRERRRLGTAAAQAWATARTASGCDRHDPGYLVSQVQLLQQLNETELQARAASLSRYATSSNIWV